jgi:hypothetical protein
MTLGTATGTLRADNDGWSANLGITGGRHCAKIGTMTTTAVNVVSPQITLNGSSTLSFRVAPFAKKNTMTVTVTTDNPDVSLSTKKISMTERQWAEFSTEMTGSGKAKITISADCPIYIDDVLVRDNTVTGIETLPGMESEKNQSDNNVYDLQGRRINSNIHKGIYIKNGAKLIK